MRVYFPATLPLLAAFVAEGGLGPPPLVAYAVTPGLREWYAEGDIEELEYAAMTHAARASLLLLGADEEAPPRRVVLAADVPDGGVRLDEGVSRGAVVVDGSVPLDHVVSVHVDDPAAADDVRAGVAALDAADLGDDDASFAVDTVAAHELLWYATQEIPDLLE